MIRSRAFVRRICSASLAVILDLLSWGAGNIPQPSRNDLNSYIADAWINEVKWLGMTITPSYVGEPECNGVIERFMRTLKEQCLYLHRFQSLAEAHRIIGEFIARYNTEWLIERLGHQTPVAARTAAMAA